MSVKTLDWVNDKLILIDQRILPHKEEYVHVTNIDECFDSIKVMVVRGAPLIGFTALYGLVLWTQQNSKSNSHEFEKAGKKLATARPTAVNLNFEVNRAIEKAKQYEKENNSLEGFSKLLEDFALAEITALETKNLNMAKAAEKELEAMYPGKKKFNLMTLCNTGFLACGPMGTALGVISYMNSQGKVNNVIASETRPYLQGGRLTAFELVTEKIPHQIVVEGAHSHILKNGLVDAIFIGADRIVSNGDTANKVGSSSLSIIASHYGIPFYVVAPISSFDLDSEDGSEIEIEMRPEEEVLSCNGVRIAPMESRALNPSFDVTDHKLIEGIFCENGIIKPVDKNNLLGVVN